MNRNLIKTIGLLVGFQILSYTVLAQRTVDIEAILKSPTDGQEIVRGEEFTISIELKNNGPDDLIEGDTLAILIGNDIVPIFLLGNIPQGETALVLESGASFGSNGGNATITDAFCVEILDINGSGASMGGVPVKVSYDDPALANNQACHEVTIKPAGGSSSIDQQQLLSENVNIFPNPADQEVTIQIEGDYASALIVRVTDLNGRIVLEQAYDATQAKSGRLSLHTGQFPVGMFIVNVVSDTKTVSGKLTVIR